MKEPHISLAAEKIGSILGLPITNSILLTWIVMLILIIFSYLATRKIASIPNPLQSITEVILDGLYNLFKSVVGDKNVATFFPLLATIFLFVIVSNWSGLLPGVGTIGFKDQNHKSSLSIKAAVANETVTDEIMEDRADSENIKSESNVKNEKSENNSPEKFTPLLRGPTADLNTTLAIALIAFFSLQYYGFKTLGTTYLTKYFNFSNPIMFFVGILEIISDLSKILSFSFRLFGNIFAGEVLLTVVAFLVPLIIPLPFLGLELFVGFIQALVFSMLTAVFLNMATMSHNEH